MILRWRVGVFALVAAWHMAVSRADIDALSVTEDTALSFRSRMARHLTLIRRDPPALRAFLQALPKGADLHVHLVGAVYAESYIQSAAHPPLCGRSVPSCRV